MIKKTYLFPILTILLVLVISGKATAAEDSAKTDQAAKTGGWKTSMAIDFSTAQTAYSDSWAGGEAGSVNWVSNLNASFEKQLTALLIFAQPSNFLLVRP